MGLNNIAVILACYNFNLLNCDYLRVHWLFRQKQTTRVLLIELFLNWTLNIFSHFKNFINIYNRMRNTSSDQKTCSSEYSVLVFMLVMLSHIPIPLWTWFLHLKKTNLLLPYDGITRKGCQQLRIHQFKLFSFCINSFFLFFRWPGNISFHLFFFFFFFWYRPACLLPKISQLLPYGKYATYRNQ